MSDFESRMQALRQRFIGEAVAEAAGIESDAAALAWNEVRDRSHRMAGRAGIFGYPDLTDRARKLEEAIDADLPRATLESLVVDLVGRLQALD